jgi:uncharacterized protein YjbI with pentapeptide repeats
MYFAPLLIFGIAFFCVAGLAWYALPRRLAGRHAVPQQQQIALESKYRKLLSEYIGGLAVVLGILITIVQNMATNHNFQTDFQERLHHDRRLELLTAAQLLKEKDPLTRSAAIYSMAGLMKSEDDIVDGVLNTLFVFVRGQRLIDADGHLLNTRVPIDVQAAITVIGRRPASDHWRDFSRLSLVQADFSFGNFALIDFKESDLRRADFSHAHVEGSTFINSYMDYRCTRVVLNGSYDPKQAFPDNLFDSASWWPAQVQTSFDHAVAKGTLFYGSPMIGAKFTGADLTGAKFDHADVTFVDFTDATYELGEIGNAMRTGPIRPEALGARVRSNEYQKADCGNVDFWKGLDIDESHPATPSSAP